MSAIASSEDEIQAGLNGRPAGDGDAGRPAAESDPALPAPGQPGHRPASGRNPAGPKPDLLTSDRLPPDFGNAPAGLPFAMGDAGTTGASGQIPGQPGFISETARQFVDWAHGRRLGLSSACGICLAASSCAAAWFSAGSRTDNFRAVAAMWAGYLALAAGRSIVIARPAKQAGRGSVAEGELSAGRARWLARLGWSLSECVIFAGLAVGASADHWPGVWTLAVTVLGLIAVRDAMAASAAPSREADEPGRIRQAVDLFLSMPPGGRILLIGIVAPFWGGRAALLALLDWGIIAIGYGLAAQISPAGDPDTATADDGDEASGRSRGQRADRRQRRRKAAEAGDDPRRPAPPVSPWPGNLVVLLDPGAVDEDGLPAAAPTSDLGAEQLSGVERTQPDLTPAGLTADPTLGELPGAEGVVRDPAPVAEAEPSEAIGLDAILSPRAAEPSAPMAGEAAAAVDRAEPSEVAGFLIADGEVVVDEAGVAAADARRPGRPRPVPRAYRTAGSAQRTSPASREGKVSHGAILLRQRDDGLLGRRLGDMIKGNVLPLPPVLLGLAATAVLAYLGMRNVPGILVVSPVLVMLLAAPGSGNPHAGRLDWLVPAMLLGWQFLYLGAVGTAEGVPGPLTFAACSALLVYYADLGCPDRPIVLVREPGKPARERASALGWEGRSLLIGIAAAIGIATIAYAVLTASLAVVLASKVLASAVWAQDRS